MKKIITSGYKTAFQENFGNTDQDPQSNEKSNLNIEIAISRLNLPENVERALVEVLHFHKDPYCQTYIRALPEAIQLGKQMGQVQEAVKSQLHYIYSNMENYQDEEAKNIIADFLKIPLEDRHEPGLTEDMDDDIDPNELV
jgi:hypothetical protein